MQRVLLMQAARHKATGGKGANVAQGATCVIRECVIASNEREGTGTVA